MDQPTLENEREKLKLNSRALFARQRDNRPSPERQPFVCEVLKGSDLLRITVDAANASDAWAIACDQWKYHPGGKAPGRLVLTAAEFRKLQAERAAASTASLA